MLTAEFLKVSLNFLPGVQEDASLFCPHGDYTVLMDCDTGHLRIQLGHGCALDDNRALVKAQESTFPKQVNEPL